MKVETYHRKLKAREAALNRMVREAFSHKISPEYDGEIEAHYATIKKYRQRIIEIKSANEQSQ